MCGARLEFPDRARTCKCKACGVLQSVPFLDNEEKTEVCRNAERLRRDGHFDKAMELLNGLIRLSPTDADLYWAEVLCRYGVAFSGNNLEVQNASAKSFLSDEDYRTALKFADESQRVVMESAAAKIDEIRRKHVQRSLNENESRDVILCCKNSGLCAKITAKLNAGGYDILSDPRDGRFTAALGSAKAAIVAGENAGDFTDELSRRIQSAFISSGRAVIPVYREISPESLPDELQKFQACNMNKLGWESDVLSSLRVIFGEISAEVPPSRSENPMLRRIYICLEDGGFSDADRIADRLIAKEKNNPGICAEAYLAKLLCEYRLSSEEELSKIQEDYTKSENYRKAMRLGSEGFRVRMRGICSGSRLFSV